MALETRLARSQCSSSTSPSRRRSARVRRLNVETLEQRLLLATVSWVTDGDGFWDVATNWLDEMGVQRVPGMDDDVVIDRGAANPTITVRSGSQSVKSLDARESLVLEGGSLAVSAASQVASDFTFNGGTLDADGPLTLTGATTWTGGVLTGSAMTSNSGMLNITTGTATVNASTLENAGTVIQTAGALVLTGATFSNLATGLIDLQGDLGVSGAGGSLGNVGMLKKSAGAGTYTVAVAINNTGTVEVDSGTLALTGTIAQHVGSTLTDGEWFVGPGATLNFATGSNITTNQASVTLSGAGSTFAKINSLATNSDTFSLQAGRDFTTAGALMNSGVLVVGDNSDLTLGAFAVLTNTGVVRKSAGPGDSIVTRVATSGGTIDVQAGTLRLPNSSGAGGTVEVKAGALLDLTAGTSVTYAGNFTGSGAGDVLLTGGVLTVGSGGASFDLPNGGLLWPDGQIDARAAGLNINSAVRLTGAAQRVLRGRVTASGSLLMAGGSLVGAGDAGAALALQGLSEWSNGQIVLLGGVANTGTLTLSGPDTKALFSTNLTNSGVIVHAGSGALNLGDGLAVVTNEAGALYDLQGDANLTAFNTSIVNAGTIRKSAGNGTSILEAPTNTGGTIEVRTGTLVLASNGSGAAGLHTGGIFNVAAGATLDLTGGELARFQGAYTGSGAGTIQFASGEIFVTGLLTLGFPGPLFQWTGGFFHAGQVANLGTMTLSGPSAKTMDQTSLDNAGTIIHTGTGNLDVASGNQELANLPGATYEIRGDAGMTVFGGSQFTNQGTLRKSSGAGASLIEHLVNQGGTIQVDAGSITLDGEGLAPSTGGTFTVAAGAILDLASANSISFFQGTYNGAGAGVVRLRSGTLSVGSAPAGGTASATFNITGGGLVWESGSITASTGGTSALTNRGLLTLAGPAVKTLSANSNLTLINQGTVRHETGTLDLSNNSMRVDNQAGATYDLLGDADVTMFGAATFTNAGTLRKSAGVGTARLGAPPASGTLDNIGVVEVLSGTLNVGAVVSQVSGSTLTGGTWNVVNGSTLTLAAGASAITTNRGSVTLDGPGATFSRIDSLTDNAGDFAVLGGRDFVTVGNLTNSGALTIGPASELAVNGSYTQGAEGALEVQLGGNPTSGKFGRLSASGPATLDGTLRVRLAGDYAPSLADSFQVVSYSSRSGEFSFIDSPTFRRGAFFQVNVGASDVTLNASTNAANLAIRSIAFTTDGVAGHDITVNYTVDNFGNATPVNNWIDSVYLSADDQLDPSDKLIGRREHQGAVAGDSFYSERLNALLPGVLAGNYRVLVLADSRAFVPDIQPGNNLAVSEVTVVDVARLTLDEMVSGTIDNGRETYLRFDHFSGRDASIEAFLGAAPGADLFVRRAQIPDLSNFDQVATDGAALSRRITLSAAASGSYYILLRGRSELSVGQAFQLTAILSPLAIEQLGVTRGANAGRVTVPLHGSGFASGLRVEVADSRGTTHLADATVVESGILAFATFDLSGLAAGPYDLTISLGPASSTLPDSFTVIDGRLGEIEAQLVMPAFTRLGRTFKTQIQYTNSGETDLTAPLFRIAGNAEFRLASADPLAQSEMDFLGISPEGPLAVLQPGQTVEVSIDTRSVVGQSADVELSVLTTDSMEPMDWDGVRTAIRPATAFGDWDTAFDSLVQESGPFLGDYVQALGEAANLMFLRTGRRSRDPFELLAFAIEERIIDLHTTFSTRLFLGDEFHPLAGATVRTRNRDTGEFSFSESTADGLLRFEDLSPGTYGFRFIDVLPPNDLQTVTVTPGEPIPPQTWIAQEGGLLSGRVVAPLDFVFTDDEEVFTAVSLVALGLEPIRIPVAADGTFSILGLRDAYYDATLEAPGFVTATARQIEVRRGQLTEVSDLILLRGGSITGTVRRADTGKPLAGLTVSVIDDSANPKVGFTDVDGRYTIAGVSAGTHTVVADDDGFVARTERNVVVRDAQRGASVDFNLGRAAILEGRVTAGGIPTPEASLVLTNAGSFVASALSDAQGNYRLADVPPGIYTVEAGRFPHEITATTVTLTAGATTALDVNLAASNVIQGVVRQAGSMEPLENVILTLILPDGTTSRTTTNKEGQFGFSRLANGSYTLMLADGSHRQQVDLAGPAQNLDRSFELAVGTISGRVLLADGLTPADSVAAFLVADSQVAFTTIADLGGRFTIPLVAPGAYSLAFGAATVDLSFPLVNGVSVVAGQETTLADVRAGSSSLSLALQDLQGQPFNVDGVALVVRADLAEGMFESQVVELDGANHVDFAGLSPGRYLVSAVGNDFALVQNSVDIVAGSNAAALSLRNSLAELAVLVRDEAGNPLGGVEASVYLSTDPEQAIGSRTDITGALRFAGLPSGEFTLVVADLRDELGGPRLGAVQRTGILLANGAALQETVTLPAATQTLTGRIDDGTGSPPVATTVEVFSLDGVKIAAGSADRDGVYSVTGLVPGTFEIRARAKGYVIAPRIIMIDDQAPPAVDLTANWVVDPPPDDDEVTPLNFLASFDSQALARFSTQLNNFLGRPQDTAGQINASEIQRRIPADCPEARAWLREALYWQGQKDKYFENWVQGFDGGLQTAIGNLGDFGFNLFKLSTTLALNVGPIVQRFDADFARQLKDTERMIGPGVDFRALANHQDLLLRLQREMHQFFDTAEKVVDVIAPATEDIAGEIRNVSGLQAERSPLVGVVEKFGSILNGTFDIQQDTLPFLADIAGSADRVLTLINLIQTLRGASGVANPALGQIEDALKTLQSAINGVVDSARSIQKYFSDKALYDHAVVQRDAALESVEVALILCGQRRQRVPLKITFPKPPKRGFKPIDTGTTGIFRSTDPNDIVGPAGFGAAGFIAPDLVLPYTIHFENLAAATAAAQVVTISHRLDADLNPATFELGDFSFGNVVVDVPDDRRFFSTRIDVRGALGLFVDVTAELNTTTGEATWTFTSIDPDTLDITADPLAGFLPPNLTSPEGEGFVSYIVRPKAGLTTGTEIRAIAEIVFDTNDPITTNQIDPQDPSKGTDPNKESLVTIDAGPPTSSVNALPAVINSASFTVSWSGSDDAGGPVGAGIASFDVFVSDNGGPFTPFQLNTPATSAMFTGQFDHTYSFFAVATDNVGHSETARSAVAEATTRLVKQQTATGPQVTDLRLPTRGRRVTGLVIAFDGDMNLTEVQRLANYELSSPGKDRQFGTRDDRRLAIRSAVYNAANRTVTLTPVKRLKINQAFQLTIEDTVTDLAGNPLDGDENAEAGGDHIVRGGAWTRIAYTDGDGDRVLLRLDRRGDDANVLDHVLDQVAGGLMEVVWGPTITGRRLTIIDTVDGESVLRGSVQRGPTGDGQTELESITGVARVRNRLPSSFVAGTVASVVDELLAHDLD